MRASKRARLVSAMALATTGAFAATGFADALTANVTATGTPGIAATVSASATAAPNAPAPGEQLHFAVTQPANYCRVASAPYNCQIGDPYPNWQADLTITGWKEASLTFASANGGFACTVSGDVLNCHDDYFNNYFKTFDVFFAGTAGSGTINANLVVSDKTATDAPPTTKDQCKKDGWGTFNTLSFKTISTNPLGYYPVFTSSFKNQGDCVSYVATGGTNLPASSGS